MFNNLELSAPFYETDEAVKAKKKETLEKETIPFYLGKLEEIAKKNNGHFALSKVCFFCVFRYISNHFLCFTVDLGRSILCSLRRLI